MSGSGGTVHCKLDYTVCFLIRSDETFTCIRRAGGMMWSNQVTSTTHVATVLLDCESNVIFRVEKWTEKTQQCNARYTEIYLLRIMFLKLILLSNWQFYYTFLFIKLKKNVDALKY